MLRIIMIIVKICLFLVVQTFHNSNGVVIPTKYGDVRGVQTDNGYAFLGVPYAAPPVGDLRWRPPTEPKSWSPDTFNATRLPPGCPQIGCNKFVPPSVCPNETSESCLFLNIWTPSTFKEKLPVMVFLHGGAFIFCFASSTVWNGEHMASMGRVIVVNLNYRLGLLGFMYTGNGTDDAIGNFGLMDQRLALKWVQDNIGHFGGDPNNVALFGQSAGAQSTLVHMMSTQSTGLFHRVIIESAPSGLPYKTPEQAKVISRDVGKLLFCEDGDMACMRSRSVGSLMDVQLVLALRPASANILELFENIGPVLDGQEVPLDVMDAALADKIRHYPAMIGTVTEESRPFVYDAVKFNMTKSEYITAVFAMYPSHSLDIVEEYPPPEGDIDSRDTLIQLVTDFLFTCPSRNISRSLELHGNQSVRRYVFDHAYASRDWGNLWFCNGHVCHGAELSLVFYNLQNRTADEDKLSRRMLYYWTNFAHTSDPNKGPNPDVPIWPTNVDMSVKYFQTPNDIITHDYRNEFCDFWDNAGYDRVSVHQTFRPPNTHSGF